MRETCQAQRAFGADATVRVPGLTVATRGGTTVVTDVRNPAMRALGGTALECASLYALPTCQIFGFVPEPAFNVAVLERSGTVMNRDDFDRK